MHEFRRFLHRLRVFLFPGRAEHDLSRELDAHIELQAEAYQGRGMTPEQARRAAVQVLGGVQQTKELHRDARSFQWLTEARQDVHYALRSYGRNPRFTLIVIAILAIGIGANTAIFSVIDSVLIEPLPYNDADRIVRVIQRDADSGSAELARGSSAMLSEDFEIWRERTQAFSSMALYEPLMLTFSNDETATRLTAASVSPAIFAVLGVSPGVGRAFNADEESSANSNVAILSHSAWQTYFGGNPDILDRPMVLEGRAHAIAGVMPEGFAFPDDRTEVWVPFEVRGRLASGVRTGQTGLALMRLDDGVTLRAAAAETAVLFPQILAERLADGTGIQMSIATLKDDLVAPVRPALAVLGAAAGFVLLIVCVNVANLLLVRADSRRREFAVRLALSAGRFRLIRQTLTESLLLAVAGGGLGTMLAFGSVRFLAAFGPGDIPRLAEAAVDSSVIGFALLVSVLTGVLFGIVPAARSFSGDTIDAFGRTRAVARRNPFQAALKNTGHFLIVCQVTIAFVLVVGAGLLATSFQRLSSVDPGYDARNVVTFRVPIPIARYSIENAYFLFSRLTERLTTLPGVEQVGSNESVPLQPYDFNLRLRFDGSAAPTTMDEVYAQPTADFHVVSLGYLKTIGVRILSGREFDRFDRADQPIVALVNETFARRYLGGQSDPIGRQFNIGVIGMDPWWTIVGVVNDVRQSGLDRQPEPEVFLSYDQVVGRIGLVGKYDRYFAIRTSAPIDDVIPSVRALVSDLDPQLPIDDVATLDQIGSDYVRLPRFYALTIGAFAAVALTLAATGIAGVTAYSVSQRSHEIGLRMALGAGRASVLRMIIGRSGRLTVTGLIIGLAGALALTRYLESLLFEVTPFDLTTFAAAFFTILLVAAVAAYVPARNATRLDPAIALRQE